MTTEETHLNTALEAAGMQVVETDLGEYIIQLAHETPSHIIAPAIHKSKKQVAELFTSTLGTPPTDDVAQLTATARAALRDRFAAADVGINGVNFGISETGTIVIVENEGNIRLTTSLPRVHIAVMGIEKVIPRFADLDLFLKLLPRSGTGQRLTTYQSFITGTKRNAQDEGPEELHIVILDNGRSRMLAHPITRQSLACIRCGACLNACPVYQQIGGHAYGSVSGADRRRYYAATRRVRKDGPTAVCLESMWRVPRSVPGEDRHSAVIVAPARRDHREWQERACGRTRGFQTMGARDDESDAVQNGFGRGANGPAGVSAFESMDRWT